jgi:hypothetical protein
MVSCKVSLNPIKYQPGWWLSPTPLKNDGVKVSWDDDIPNWMESHKIPWFQSPPTSSWIYLNPPNHWIKKGLSASFCPEKHESIIITSPYISIHILHGLTPCIQCINDDPNQLGTSHIQLRLRVQRRQLDPQLLRLLLGSLGGWHLRDRSRAVLRLTRPWPMVPAWSLWNVENPYFLP